MNNILTRFKEETKKDRSASSFICFGRAIKGGNYHKGAIISAFVKLVDKDDYDKSDIEELLEHCQKLNKVVLMA